MKPLDIYIDDKKYEYIDNIYFNDKYYVAFADNAHIYIKEYLIHNNSINFIDINDTTFYQVKEIMNI